MSGSGSETTPTTQEVSPLGKFHSCYAVAHSQIEDKDPLRFFVTNEGEVIINPIIVNQTKFQVLSKEGCLTFREEEDDDVHVKRSRKITVEYSKLIETPEGALEISDPITVEKSNLEAFIFQHEIDHMDGVYIYDKD